MSRNADPTFMAALTAAKVKLVVFASLAFRSQTQYVHSAVGPYVWNGNTYLGVGSLGSVGAITECGESNAQGTTVSLSGIDPAFLGAAMADIRQGGNARIWLATFDEDARMIGTPYLAFRGQIDKAPVSMQPLTRTITLNLETRLIDHGRLNARRYAQDDQRANGYPDDTSMGWVEQLSDQALFWNQ